MTHRVNKAVELLAQGQPVYFQHVTPAMRSYEAGKAAAQTWADYLYYDLEHTPFDMGRLSDFMHGLVDGGPTRSGHRTPAVVVVLPTDGTDEQVVRANAWMVKHVLTTGVHGIMLPHAETAGAVRAFVEAARYPFQTQGVGDGLGPGRRGDGGQTYAAGVWGVSTNEYFATADPWPLNPRGELLLGLKVENIRAVANVEESTRVPGIAFAECGAGDMGMSLGYPDQHDKTDLPADLLAARGRVIDACAAAGVLFLGQVTANTVVERLAAGVMIGSGPHAREASEVGRPHTRRTMPW